MDENLFRKNWDMVFFSKDAEKYETYDTMLLGLNGYVRKHGASFYNGNFPKFGTLEYEEISSAIKDTIIHVFTTKDIEKDIQRRKLFSYLGRSTLNRLKDIRKKKRRENKLFQFLKKPCDHRNTSLKILYHLIKYLNTLIMKETLKTNRNKQICLTGFWESYTLNSISIKVLLKISSEFDQNIIENSLTKAGLKDTSIDYSLFEIYELKKEGLSADHILKYIKSPNFQHLMDSNVGESNRIDQRVKCAAKRRRSTSILKK